MSRHQSLLLLTLKNYLKSSLTLILGNALFPYALGSWLNHCGAAILSGSYPNIFDLNFFRPLPVPWWDHFLRTAVCENYIQQNIRIVMERVSPLELKSLFYDLEYLKIVFHYSVIWMPWHYVCNVIKLVSSSSVESLIFL